MPGTDNATKIRNFIIDYNANHGTMFVLLAGSTSTIPSRRGYSDVSGTYRQRTGGPVHGDLQWSWDGDHDGTYGEAIGDTVDFYYDVYVGRWPVASVANAQTLVNKVFGYERRRTRAMSRRSTCRAVNLFTGYSGKCVEDTITNITPSGWTDTEVNSPSPSTFQSAINTGYGYCHAAAHGDDYGFYTDMGSPIYTSTQAAAQTNGMDKLVIMNSMACISGNFQNMGSVSVSLANNANGGGWRTCLTRAKAGARHPHLDPRRNSAPGSSTSSSTATRS